MLCLLLKVLLALHCKLALYYVQQSGAASQRSVQTFIPLCMCCYTCRLGRLWAALVHVAFIWVWVHRSPVTLIFLPTLPRKPSSESYSSSIERYIERYWAMDDEQREFGDQSRRFRAVR